MNDKEIEELFGNIRQVITQQALKVVEEELNGDEADVLKIIKLTVSKRQILGSALTGFGFKVEESELFWNLLPKLTESNILLNTVPQDTKFYRF